MAAELIEQATQFGVAGLMGVLWVWERRLSQKREAQLSETHRRLQQQGMELAELVELVRANTRAVERFEQTQARLCSLLEKMESRK